MELVCRPLNCKIAFLSLSDGVRCLLCLDLSSFLFTLQKTPVEFFGVPLDDKTLLQADPRYVLLACKPALLPNDAACEEHLENLISGFRTPKQTLRSFLLVVAGLDPEKQDECFKAIVCGLQEASEDGFSHVIGRLEKGNTFVFRKKFYFLFYLELTYTTS